MALRGAWQWYLSQLSTKPVRTQVATSGLLWTTGDVLAQYVAFVTLQTQSQTHRLPLPSSSSSSSSRPQFKPQEESSNEATFHIDWPRALRVGAFGSGFVGPVGHFWYQGLEYFTRQKMKLLPGSSKLVIVKLLADTVIMGPTHLLTFFTYMGFVSGDSPEQVKKLIQRDFVPAFLSEGALWPIVQICNFRFVPVQHQLLYVNSFCLLDSAFLSWFKHQEDAPWKKRLKSFVLEWK